MPTKQDATAIREEQAPAGRRLRGVDRLEPALVVALGLALFWLRFGWVVLNPRSIDWMMGRGDPAVYYLAWDFFRHDPWAFPLGMIQSYLYPLGAALPLADGLPILAFPAKLFAPLLPAQFQYFGFWHLCCAVLQGVFAYRIVRRFLPDTAGRLLGVALFLITPTFMFREGHIALSSHWLLLAALDLYLAGRDETWRRALPRWCLLMGVAALVHPYLVAMCLLLFGGLLLQPGHRAAWPWRGRLATAVAVGGVVLVVWWVAGNLHDLSTDRTSVGGFGIYSLNLTAPFNPMERAFLLPSYPVGIGQYEGFAYLGAGWLLLVAAAAACVWRDQPRARLHRHRGLAVVLAATGIFALSNIVVWKQTVVLQYLLLPVFESVTGTFRSSGRFVWPILYVGMAAVVATLGRLRARAAVVVLLAVALGLQVWDLRGFVFQQDDFAAVHFDSRLDDPNWEIAATACDAIMTAPPFNFTTVLKDDFRDIGWLAASHRLPTSGGAVARTSLATTSLTDSLRHALDDGTANPQQLYICNGEWFPEVLAGLGEASRGTMWDGFYVCYHRDWPVTDPPRYPAAHRQRLAPFLAERQDRILLLAGRDEVTASLSADDRAGLQSVGLDDGAIAYRGAFAAIVRHGQAVWQRTAADQAVELALAAGDTLGPLHLNRAIGLASAGFTGGNRAQLLLDGQEEGFGGRGLNVLVLDDDQRLREVAWFDTHIGRPGVVVTVAIP